MKYISMALLILVLGLGTGCNRGDSYEHQLNKLIASTGELYFNAGYICAVCEDMKHHPENFKDGAVEKMKDKCAQFKDFETFHKISKEGTLHE